MDQGNPWLCPEVPSGTSFPAAHDRGGVRNPEGLGETHRPSQIAFVAIVFFKAYSETSGVGLHFLS